MSNTVLVLSLAAGVANADYFNYGFTDQSVDGQYSYAQPVWDQVQCSNLNDCTGFPNPFPFLVYAKDTQKGNNCRWCPEGGSFNCGLHRQSPIDLLREVGMTTGPEYKECPDWHWMQFKDDTCSWEDMKNQFSIERDGLKISIPQLPNGDIDCLENGQRVYPRIDYSKGFADWWFMQRMEVRVPSNHVQNGHRYAAEVTLSHFYSVENQKNQLGHVALFLQDWPGAESWPYLDKLICAWRHKEEEVRSACNLPPAPAYGMCQLFRGQQSPGDTSAPTASPNDPANSAEPPTKIPTGSSTQSPIKSPTGSSTQSPTKSGTNSPSAALSTPQPVIADSSVPAPISCSDFDVSYSRMCFSTDPCCGSVRADTDYCWNLYDSVFPGDLIKSACYHCCPGQAMIVGDPAPALPNLPQTITCSDVSNPFRICKSGGCCGNPRSTSAHCLDIYAQYGNDIDQLCYYCCREPQFVGPPLTRRLRSISNNTARVRQSMIDYSSSSLEEEVQEYFEETLPVGSKTVYVGDKKFVLRPENFVESEENDEEYFRRIYSDYERRSLSDAQHEVDYADVEYWPYEWMLKVDTEYYFRYEGTELVPPCWEIVHWRVMKDPIVVHKRQIDELARLLAWRLNPDTCATETSGVLNNDGSRVDMKRELQYKHKQHRMVFCECKNWPSKFPGDRAWCRNWDVDVNYNRFFQRPYSFNTGGEWLP